MGKISTIVKNKNTALYFLTIKNYGTIVRPTTNAVPIITAASIIATPIFPFFISSHSLIGVIFENIFTKTPRETAIEIAPVKAQPNVMR